MHIGALHDWLAHAQAEYRERLGAGETEAALACATRTLARIHEQLGAPPAAEFWLDELDGYLARWSMAPPPEVEPLVFDAALAVLARRPAHPALPLWHGRALARVRSGRGPAHHALRAANFSFEYALRSGDFRLAREIVFHARPHCARAEPPVRAAWLQAEALEAWLSADHARARALVAQALADGAGYGAWEQGASAALSEGDLAHADRCLAQMARSLDTSRLQDVGHERFLRAARARLGGDTKLASECIDACSRVDSAAIPLYFLTLWQLGRAHIAIARGQHRRAAGDLTAVLARAGNFYWEFQLFSALVGRTWLRIRQGRDLDAARDLHRALALARAHGYRNTDPWWDPEAIGEIERWARSIEHDRPALAALGARERAP